MTVDHRADSVRHELEQSLAATMTDALARKIRWWRVNEGHSWRRIGELAKSSGVPVPADAHDQILGIVLCHLAARFLNEKPNEAPWN